jgi:hypothetical protein
MFDDPHTGNAGNTATVPGFNPSRQRTMTEGICVDSRARVSGDDNNFHVTIPTFSNITRIKLESVEIPNTLYDIDATNNVIDYLIDTTTYASTITTGSYNGADLAALMNTIMFATYTATYPAGTVVVTFDESANKFSIANNGETLNLMAATGANVTTGIWEALGFDATDFITIADGSTTPAQNTAQLKNGENYVFMRLDGYGSLGSSDGDCDIFAKVQNDDLLKFREHFSVAKTYSAHSPLPLLRTFRCSIKRRDGSFYKLRSNPWSFTLLITYVQ